MESAAGDSARDGAGSTGSLALDSVVSLVVSISPVVVSTESRAIAAMAAVSAVAAEAAVRSTAGDDRVPHAATSAQPMIALHRRRTPDRIGGK